MIYKLQLTFILLLNIINANFLFSQSLPNSDFEEWHQEESFFNPVGWGTSNFTVLSVITFNPVSQESNDVYSGNSCVKLETKEQIISGNVVKVAGLITLGTFDINIATVKAKVFGGIPFTEKPSLLSGYYKYSTPNTDSCIMSIFLTKFNETTLISDTIGTGIFTSGNQSEWSLFEAPIIYNTDVNPDSMNIVILSSDTSIFDSGSTLLVDSISLDITTNISSNIIEKEISVFPNPVNDILKINISTNNYHSYRYSIISSNGQIISNSRFYSNEETIDVSGFRPGIYFIKINSSDNSILTKTIVIK